MTKNGIPLRTWMLVCVGIVLLLVVWIVPAVPRPSEASDGQARQAQSSPSPSGVFGSTGPNGTCTTLAERPTGMIAHIWNQHAEVLRPRYRQMQQPILCLDRWDYEMSHWFVLRTILGHLGWPPDLYQDRYLDRAISTPPLPILLPEVYLKKRQAHEQVP